MLKIYKSRIRLLYTISLLIFLQSCGGGGGGGSNTLPVTTGAVQGYVYIPYGSAPTRAVADTTGYKPYSGATVKATCGTTVKSTTSSTNGYFKISSLPTVNCSIEAKINGYITQTTQIVVKSNQTVTIGSTDGIKMTPNTHGEINVNANIAGGMIILDSENTGIVIPSSLSYTLPYVNPGTHTVNVTKSGFDTVATQTITVMAGTSANVRFTMNPTGNLAPIANAGSDGKTFVGKYYTAKTTCEGTGYTSNSISYTLDGSGSSDMNSNTLTYKWEQTSGSTVTLSSATASKTTFIPASAETYTFKLTVNDGYLDSTPDNVNVVATHISGKIVFKAVGCGSHIYSMNADGTNLRQLTNNNYYNDGPRWSPDGTKIMFTTNPSGDEEIYYIATMNQDGSNVQVLPIQGGGQDWSPDGQHLLLRSIYNGTYQLFISDINGQNNNRITNTNFNILEADYSPDGSKMVFIQDHGGDNWEIYTINTDGSNLVRLTNDNKAQLYAFWTGTNKIIFGVSDTIPGNITVYTMNPDGTGQQQIIFPTNKVYNARMTNEDQFIYYSDNNSLIHFINLDGSGVLNIGMYGGSVDYSPNP